MDGSDESAKQKDLERSKKHLSNLREEEKKMKIPQDQAKLKAALEFLRDECWLVETAPLWEAQDRNDTIDTIPVEKV